MVAIGWPLDAENRPELRRFVWSFLFFVKMLKTLTSKVKNRQPTCLESKLSSRRLAKAMSGSSELQSTRGKLHWFRKPGTVNLAL
jgi:hypothetical protein